MLLLAMGPRKQHLVLAVPSRSKRAAGRQKVGRLQDDLVGVIALERYSVAVGLFLAWLFVFRLCCSFLVVAFCLDDWWKPFFLRFP